MEAIEQLIRAVEAEFGQTATWRPLILAAWAEVDQLKREGSNKHDRRVIHRELQGRTTGQ